MITLELSDVLSILAVVISAGAVWYTRKATQLKKESIEMERLRLAPRLELSDMRNMYISMVAFQLKNVGGCGKVESLEVVGEYDMELSPEEIVLGEGTTFSVICMQILQYLENPYSDKIRGTIIYSDETGRRYSQKIWMDGGAPKIGAREVES